VHLIRNSLAFVAWQDRKAILPAIKAIYRAENVEMATIRPRCYASGTASYIGRRPDYTLRHG